MQTIFIVVSGFDYEGTNIESVHSTRESAELKVAEIKASGPYTYDYVGIEEYNVRP